MNRQRDYFIDFLFYLAGMIVGQIIWKAIR